MRRNLLTAALQNNSNNSNNGNGHHHGDNFGLDSPINSKASSSDSLNYLLLRKDVASAYMDQHNHNQLSNSDFTNGANSSHLAKKKSLKTTLYRMFTQRKKAHKMRNLQNGIGGAGSGDVSAVNEQNYYSDLSQSQLTIKPDKNLKKK
jgi:hypothetical protein